MAQSLCLLMPSLSIFIDFGFGAFGEFYVPRSKTVHFRAAMVTIEH